MKGPTMPNTSRGKTVKTHKEVADLKKCTNLCDENDKCKSLLYHSKLKVCTLKEKELDGSEKTNNNEIFFSVFRACKEGKDIIQFDLSLKIFIEKILIHIRND